MRARADMATERASDASSRRHEPERASDASSRRVGPRSAGEARPRPPGRGAPRAPRWAQLGARSRRSLAEVFFHSLLILFAADTERGLRAGFEPLGLDLLAAFFADA